MGLRNDINAVMRSQSGAIGYGLAAVVLIVGLALLAYFQFYLFVIAVLGAVIVGGIWLLIRSVFRSLTDSGGR